MSQVFTVQKRMRDVTLGSSTFEAMADRRIELRKGYHITISSLMVLVRILLSIFCILLRLFMRVSASSFTCTALKRLCFHERIKHGLINIVLHISQQHSDRILFKSMMEDRSIMRMTSKMKLVLDNTDNSSHYRYV